MFATNLPTHEQEEGATLAPRFDAQGLITAVATDAETGEVLMVAHMNAEALQKTIETGQAHYWSRSRKALWLKGGTSGHVQHVAELRVDCDQDAVWMKVRVNGQGQCHVGYPGCFYRAIPVGTGPLGDKAPVLQQVSEKSYDPKAVYGH